MLEIRRTAKIESGILIEDAECKFPSIMGFVVLGNANNGGKQEKERIYICSVVINKLKKSKIKM